MIAAHLIYPHGATRRAANAVLLACYEEADSMLIPLPKLTDEGCGVVAADSGDCLWERVVRYCLRDKWILAQQLTVVDRA
jgi:hypothetical protein